MKRLKYAGGILSECRVKINYSIRRGFYVDLVNDLKKKGL